MMEKTIQVQRRTEQIKSKERKQFNALAFEVKGKLKMAGIQTS
jgi:hypothetical protein